MAIKGILFDFGGTLDTNGDHWSEVLWRGYQHFGIAVEKKDFRDAYVHGERTLATHPIVTADFHFVDVLRAKLRIQLEWLSGHGFLPALATDNVETLADDMARYVDGLTHETLAHSREVLSRLKATYPLVLVSNFYGNIQTVLKDAGLDSCFRQVIESAVVGVRKPNPAIFALGVCALDLPASEVLVVGDSYTKDILPARSLGCHTLWIKGLQWEDTPFDETLTDGVITCLDHIFDYLK